MLKNMEKILTTEVENKNYHKETMNKDKKNCVKEVLSTSKYERIILELRFS